MAKFGPIGEAVYRRTYARGNENWEDTVARVARGNVELGVQDEIQELERLIGDMKLMPGGRHLWVTGVPGRQFLFNCHRAGWTDNWEDHFCFTFDELMKGGGVGANYSNEYLMRAEPFVGATSELYIDCIDDHENVDDVHPDRVVLTDGWLDVTDSREGWVSALEAVIRAHRLGQDLPVIDVSLVRPRGQAIRGFGGTASGPGPLVSMLRRVDALLRECAGRRLDSLEAMQIDHEIASCVIAGNVRRSARMSVKHWADPDILDFINAKSDSHSHWTTNISVEVDSDFWEDCHNDKLSFASIVLDAISDGMLRNGEPGIFNSSAAAVGEDRDVRCPNPCGEIALEEWENCNLGNINLAKFDDFDELLDAARVMTRFLIRATMSDSVTNFRQREVLERNRRIGVGIMGFQEWCINAFDCRYSDSYVDEEITWALQELQNVIQSEAESYAKRLGIATPIKTTCVAPTGTVSQVAGVTAGIHPVYAKEFIRRVRYASNDSNIPLDADFFETDIYSDDTTVAAWYCKDAIYEVVPAHKHHLIEAANEIALDDMLSVLRMVQAEYANNAVSFTANVTPGVLTARGLRALLEDFGPDLKGVTIMPDESRPQAPFERVSHGLDRIGSSLDDCTTGACPIR